MKSEVLAYESYRLSFLQENRTYIIVSIPLDLYLNKVAFF